MSTRATYQFNSELATVTYYVHYDGYAEGAAQYFREAMLHENQRGGLASAFIRANDYAEVTGGHDSHWDTAFRWTVDGDTLIGQTGDFDGVPENCYVGSLLAFVNMHHEPDEKICLYEDNYYSKEGLVESALSYVNNAKAEDERGRARSAFDAAENARDLLEVLDAGYSGYADTEEYKAMRAEIDAIHMRHLPLQA